jgi:hypothetical protein
MITPTTNTIHNVAGIPFRGGAVNRRFPYGAMRDSWTARYQAIETKGNLGGLNSEAGHRACGWRRTRLTLLAFVEHLFGTLSYGG